MPEIDRDLKNFMEFWFSGFASGLENIDESARDAVLRECGKACARSYTAGVFREAWNESTDMAEFLAALGERFPDASYELLDAEPGARPGAEPGAETIRVRYSRCGCDLVETGLVTSPLICDCSAHNLRENFAQALERPVAVTLESSILRGATRCEFSVVLGA